MTHVDHKFHTNVCVRVTPFTFSSLGSHWIQTIQWPEVPISATFPPSGRLNKLALLFRWDSSALLVDTTLDHVSASGAKGHET